jgi:hypothetical protein
LGFRFWGSHDGSCFLLFVNLNTVEVGLRS